MKKLKDKFEENSEEIAKKYYDGLISYGEFLNELVTIATEAQQKYADYLDEIAKRNEDEANNLFINRGII